MHRTRSVLMASVILVFGSTSFAVARTGDPINEGERNGTSTKETEIVSNIAAGTGSKGGYSTRQSNKSTTGGGAIYGCRSTGAASTNPCVRANNLAAGKAFEFNATSGPSAGTITVGSGGDTKKPFTTNATGVADGLNADRVDGQNAADIVNTARATNGLNADQVDGASASQLRTRWLLVNAAGQIERQSGGFTVTAAYPGADASPQGAAAGNVYINAGEDLTDNGITATIALQNQTDQNGDGEARGTVDSADSNPEFSGEITTTQCALPGIVVCGPAGTNNANHFVVSPRNSDGSRTTATTNRKRFYVMITE
jgi:hypothetical protein